MNDETRFERLFADALPDLAPSRAPDRIKDHIKQETSRKRPRPRWLALIKEPPMRISSHLAVGSPTARVVAIVVATLLIAISVAAAGIAGSRLLAATGDIVVDPSGNGTTTTITEAVAMAEDGDTILVKPGTYDESIWGGASPTIEANTIVNIPDGIGIQDTGWQISDTGTDPIIRGNTISGATLAAINVDRDASATIVENVLLGNGVGINVRSDALIEGNRIGDGAAGIAVFGGSPSLIGNAFEGLTGNGIFVALGTSPTLSGNTSCNNGVNLEIVDGATPDIDDTNEICEDAPTE